MSFRRDNDAYDVWLARHCDVVKKDVRHKHKRMTKNRFIFLRATTYFRWARKIAAWCPEVMDAPKVLRRIAGDSRKIELGDNAGIHLRLLQAMGFDLAAIHAASPNGAAAIRADLKKRPRGWLNAAGEAAAIEVRRDFREWKKAFRERS